MKKHNRKGFTLAELLIVVAILAILIAVAIPIYTSAMRDAQIRVNTSNGRALRGAAVAEILSRWTTGNDTDHDPYSEGDPDGDGSGWIAWASFSEDGEMDDVHVKNATNKTTGGADLEGVYEGDDAFSGKDYPEGTPETLGESYLANPNTIVVYLTGTDINN